MAEVQLSQKLLPDPMILAAAKARKLPEYARPARDRARQSIRQGTDSGCQVQLPGPFAEEDNVLAFPPLPAIDFKGLHEVEDVDMLDVLAGPGTNHVTMSPQEDTGLDQAEIEERVYSAIQDIGTVTNSPRFEGVQRWFVSIANPTLEHRVLYGAAKRKLDIHKKTYESRKALQEKEQLEKSAQSEPGMVQKVDNELFVHHDSAYQDPVYKLLELDEQPTENNVKPTMPAPIPPRINKKKLRHRISAAEKRKSMEVGFEPIHERLQGKNKRKRGPRKPKNTSSSWEDDAGIKNKGNKSTNGNPMMPLDLGTNVVEEAHASSALPAPAAFNATNRKDAMAQLISSIPCKDREEAIDDKMRLQNALRKFTKPVRPDPEGGWRIKGLKTSLYNYQVLGSAFMRERENSPEDPRGGILADVMGIGKTLEALVNILDGHSSNQEDPTQTTLLIVPSHLTKHWMDQMRKHCEKGSIGRVVEYHSRSRLSTLDDAEDLGSYSIVVTTYEEIRASYPTFKPPKELSNEKTLREQWSQIYEENRGPLHRIKFHRIVLDEAHTIKNWKSSVSIGVRGLVGQHKWLLSGTPVMNYNEEFYPLLSFLDVPGIKNHAEFISYYRDDNLGNERLSNLLRAYMCRRTHASRLFALPIIRLPDIEETKIDVEFSEAEWVIYQAIEKGFFESINDLGSDPHFKAAQCRCCLTMILRLRMFCSHPLTVQHLLKHLLGSDDSLMGELSKIPQNGNAGNTDPSTQIYAWLVAAKNDYKNLVQQRREEQLDQISNNHMFTNNPTLVRRFHELMKRLSQENDCIERYDRTVCPNCDLFSDKTVVTSCLHLYCEECFIELQIAADNARTVSGRMEKPKPRCQKCTNLIEEATRCGLPEEVVLEKPTTPEARRQMIVDLISGKGRPRKNGNPEADDEDKDWIRACGARMPGAKLNKIREIIKDWKRTAKDTKVVIFSQFTDFIRILADMCQEERWGFRCLSGKMRIPARHKSLHDFEKNPEITILIVSLHTGGTGLDMTVAHKCILVDLWWNEAIQNQAFCRLLRHGQTKNVECVKMIVKGSIDEYMLDLQTRKTEDIKSTMGDDILKKRDTVITLLKLFADVDEDGSGRLFVRPKAGRNRQGKLKEALSLGKAHNTAKQQVSRSFGNMI